MSSKRKTNIPNKPAAKAGKPAKRSDTPAEETLQTPSPEPVESKKPAPAKKVFETLGGDGHAPVMVTYEGTISAVKPTKQAKFSHTLKLQATSYFQLSKTVMIEDGPHAGSQAILISPAKTFPFLKLSPELRMQVYEHYFAPAEGKCIEVDAKRNTTREVYAKKYAQGSRYRVGLLGVSKEINAAAMPVLYDHVIRFPSSGFLLDLLTQLPPSHRNMLKEISIHNYQKPNARTAFNLLTDAAQLKHVKIEQGITTDGDVKKAAKGFYNDASKILETRLASTEDVDKAMDVFTLGAHALATKDGIKTRPWPSASVEEFRQALREKLL